MGGVRKEGGGSGGVTGAVVKYFRRPRTCALRPISIQRKCDVDTKYRKGWMVKDALLRIHKFRLNKIAHEFGEECWYPTI